MIFTFSLVSVFIFLLFFQFPDSHHKNFTLSDFHQEVVFNPIFLPPPGVYIFVCSFVCLSFWCFDYSKSNEQIFIIFFMLEGRGQKKKLLFFWKDLDHILDKKNPEYSEDQFSIYFQ